MRGALDVLPDDQSAVVKLAYFGGMSHSEIAELLDMPLGKGALARRAFTVHVAGGALELRFGGATGFGVAALLIEKASALVPDPLEAGAVRAWRISERHPNPDWAPLRTGQADLGAYFTALRVVGYDGWVTVEDFSTALPLAERTRDNLAYLRTLAG